jgi:hypothetical protein
MKMNKKTSRPVACRRLIFAFERVLFAAPKAALIALFLVDRLADPAFNFELCHLI